MTDDPRTGDRSAEEVLRLTLRVRELGTALRNRQETFNDMLEQLQVREEEAVHLAGERAARTAAEAAAERLRFLAEASALLSGSLNFEATLPSVARLAVPIVADLCVVNLVDANGMLRRLASHHRDPRKIDLVHLLGERLIVRASLPSGAVSVPSLREPEVVLDIAEADERRAPDLTRILRQLEITSYIIVPVLNHDDVFGTLAVAYAGSNRRYSQDDVTLIEDVGRRAGVAIRTARLVRGLEEARQRLQEQSEELEAQTEELQGTTEELELNSEELATANELLAAETEKAEHARAAAEAANAAKSEFLATMSHELRTPLNAISGYGELLAMGIHGDLNEAQLEAIERIRRSQQRLLSLVNDVLNVARLESGRVDFQIKDVLVTEIFDNLDGIVQPQMQLKGLRYRFEPCAADVRVRADQEKMEQVLLNLLSNAMKFTESGGEISVVCEVDSTSVGIHVSDTGRGIPAEKLEQIFEPFVQVNPTRAGHTEGVGLGLAISRDLARAMDGELAVESVLGEGTTFTFRLPRAEAPAT